MILPFDKLSEILGIDTSDLDNKRYICRFCAALYRYHFVRVNENDWAYIGSCTPAEALLGVSEAIPYLSDVENDDEWKDMEGR